MHTSEQFDGHHLAWGTARANGIDTPYVHAGRGAPIIVMAGENPSLAKALVARLSAKGKAIAPLAKADRLPEFASVSRLRTFLEALSTQQAMFIATQQWIGVTLSLALSEPWRVGRIILAFDSIAATPETSDMERAEMSRPQFSAVGLSITCLWEVNGSRHQWIEAIASIL